MFIGREIPNDLITEIFSRLPAKSIARLRCVSKQWASILHRPQFTEMFLTVSSARPCLLFAWKEKCKLFFFSARQPLNPDKNSPPSLVVDHHKPCPLYFTKKICSPVHGLICTDSMNPMICNPSTGEFITLPTPRPLGIAYERTFFGYDPINKIFKVLLSVCKGCRVLTLELGQLSWRTIECSISHAPLGDENGICINGVLYYIAYGHGHGNGYPNPCMVVCFDVRFEKFKFIAMDDAYTIWRSTLINCKGRLGAVRYDLPAVGGHAELELLVLDDVDEEKWSKHIYVLPPLPPLWRDLTPKTMLRIVGMTCTGEFVLAHFYTLPDPFSIFYYNVERNTLVRVEIELGIVVFMLQYVYIFIDHIENVKPIYMEMLRT